MSLRKQATSGLLWTFGQQFSTQIISFSISVVMARLLLPSDFGTIAMFGVVMSIGATLIDGGMASSLIRSKDTDEADLSTVFWFNLAIAVGLYIIIFFSAPLISRFYNIAILTPVIRVYCLILVIDSLVTVQIVKFTKELDFKTAFKIQLPSQIIGGLTGMLFAYFGFGIWSIVFYTLIQNTISTIQYWFYSDWRPSFVFDKKKFSGHFGFGYRLTVSNLLNTVFNNIYTVVIGKMFSPVQLGFYNRADTLKQLPINNLSTALNKVTFPLFSKLKDDNVKLKEVYKKLMKLVVFIIAPILCLMIVIANPMINFLFTDKWLPSVPYFQVLAIAGILYPVHSYNLNILKVKGRSDLFLKLELIKKVLVIIVLIVSLRYGIMGLVWGQVIISFVAFFINTHYTGKILNYGPLSQMLDLLPVILLSSVLGFIFYFIDKMFLLHFADIIQIVAVSVGYGCMYIIAIRLLKFKEITYLKDLLKR